MPIPSCIPCPINITQLFTNLSSSQLAIAKLQTDFGLWDAVPEFKGTMPINT